LKVVEVERSGRSAILEKFIYHPKNLACYYQIQVH
jgi:hypothetical protein